MEFFGIFFFLGLLVLAVFGFIAIARVMNGPPVKAEDLVQRNFDKNNIVVSGITIFGIKPDTEIFVQTNDFKKRTLPLSVIEKIDLSHQSYSRMGRITDVFTVTFNLASGTDDKVELASTNQAFFEQVVLLLQSNLSTKLRLI